MQEFEDIVLAQFSQGTEKLATVGINMPVIVWDAQSLDSPWGPKEIIKFDIEGDVSCIAISPDGNWVAACQDRSIILRRCCASDAPVLKLDGHLGEVNSIEFSPDSQSLVSTSRDQTVRVWGAMNQPVSKTLTGHTASVAHASFDPKGKHVVSASADGTIRVWDVATEEELASLPWHGESVNEASFSRDGRILSASDDGSVKIGTCETCDMSIDELRRRVEQYAQLTREGQQWVKAATTVKIEWLQGLLDRFGN